MLSPSGGGYKEAPGPSTAFLRLRVNSASVGSAEDVVVASRLVVSSIEVVVDSTAEVLVLVNLVNWPNAPKAPARRRPEDKRMMWVNEWLTQSDKKRVTERTEQATKRKFENEGADGGQPEPKRYGGHHLIYF
jgi:hypothetical protein